MTDQEVPGGTPNRKGATGSPDDRDHSMGRGEHTLPRNGGPAMSDDDSFEMLGDEFLKQFKPGETFIECCGTHAGLVIEVDEYGDLEFVDLTDGHTGGCSAFHCGPVILEPTTAMAIALLGDDFKAAKDRAYELLRDENGNLAIGDMNTNQWFAINIMRVMREQWETKQ